LPFFAKTITKRINNWQGCGRGNTAKRSTVLYSFDFLGGKAQRFSDDTKGG
jgi:hypothetical protein